MIKATELRIGNLVFVKSLFKEKPDNLISVETIGEEGINILWAPEGIYETKFEDLIPIPLTEEWLLKFGFENNTSNKKWFHKKCGDIEISVFIDDLMIEIDSNGDSIIIQHKKIQFIHQFQNFCFPLTGTELMVK